MKSTLIVLIGIFVMLAVVIIHDGIREREAQRGQRVEQAQAQQATAKSFCFEDIANLYGEIIKTRIPCPEDRPHLLILESVQGISTTKLRNLEECTAIKGAWLSEKRRSNISRQAEANCILITQGYK